MRLFWQPFHVQFGSILARLEVHYEAVQDEIALLTAAKLIRVCQLELQQLKLTEKNSASLEEIQEHQEELITTICDSVNKIQTGKAKENEKYHQTIHEHGKEIEAVMELLTQTEFGKNQLGSYRGGTVIDIFAIPIVDTCGRIREYLAAPDFEDGLYQARKQRKESTGLWLMKHSSILKWVASPENVFWINGT